MKQLLYQGIFWRGLNYLTVFLVTITVARLFQARDSGTINYTLNNLALVILITSMCLESATGYYNAKGTIPVSELVGMSLMMIACSLIIAFPIIHWLLRIGDPGALTGCLLYCVGAVTCNYFNALYYSNHQYIFPNIITVLLNLAVATACLFFKKELLASDVSIFILLYGSAFFLNGLMLVAGYLHRTGWKLSLPALANTKKIFWFATLALAGNIIFFLVYRVDYWFVHRNSSAADLGNYIQVSKLGQIFLVLPGVIGTIVFARTASAASDGHLRELQVLSRLLLLAYLITVLLLLITGQWFFPFLYGATFRSMYLPFLLLIPGILSLSTLTLVTAYNAGRGNLAVNIRGALIALLVIVAGNLIFSARFGMYAAAAISSAGYIAYQVYVMMLLRRENVDIKIASFFIPRQADLFTLKNLFVREEKG